MLLHFSRSELERDGPYTSCFDLRTTANKNKKYNDRK